MKDYRLDHVDWYDAENDLIICLACGKKYQTLSMHIKKHGFNSGREYKDYYGILPKTPIQNKAILKKKSEAAMIMRADGRFKVYKKGETGIPKEYQDRETYSDYKANPEYASLISSKVKGLKRSEEAKRNMSECRKGVHPEHLKKFAFKKGHKPASFKYEFCTRDDCNNKHIARGLCGYHYRQLPEIKEKQREKMRRFRERQRLNN